MSAPAMMTAEENDLLCRVEGGAPMGRLMRAHWVPALLSEEVAEPDGAPVAVRVLGEDLVAFRDTEGRVGVLDELCPHRRASLLYARNEKCGLRCLYHGWKMDVDGNVVEMASEPPGSGFRDRVRARAYPARECAGFVWIWMGEGEPPPFERPSFAPTDEVRVSILKMVVPANWAQILEGQIDSSHSSSLHASDMVPARVDSAGAEDTRWLRPSTDKAPRMQLQRTSYGFRYVALRKPIKNASTHVYGRVTVYVAPFVALIPPNTSYNVASVIVPRGDTESAFYFVAWGDPETCIDTGAWRRFNHTVVGEDLDEGYRNWRSRENAFGQDREAMRAGDTTGIAGIPNQDYAMWVSMGAIVDRTRERLGASDLAIVEFRRLMVEAARAVAGGAPAIGTGAPRIAHAAIASWQGIVAKETDWRTLGTSAAELEELGLPGEDAGEDGSEGASAARA